MPRPGRGPAGATLAMVIALGVAGCGFRPMYGDAALGASPAASSSASASEPSTLRDLAAVDVARIPNRAGQELRNQLSDQLNPARLDQPSLYRLNVNLGQESRQLAIDRQGLATRSNLTMHAAYSLTEVATGRVIFSSSARTIVGYDILAGQPTSYFSTVVARQDAQSRAITQIAQQLTARISAFFEKHPGGHGADELPAAAPEIEPGFSEESDTPLGSVAPPGMGIGGSGPFGSEP